MLMMLLCLSAVQAQDDTGKTDEATAKAKKTFISMFGETYTRVRKSPPAEDDLELAQRLLTAGRSANLEPALQKVILDAVFELASPHLKGLDMAVEAMYVLAKHQPDHNQAALERIFALRQQHFYKARGEQKTEIGKLLINGLGVSACLHHPLQVVFDQQLIGCRLNLHGLLGQSVEEFPSRLGLAAVEAERELIEVVVKVLVADRALVGSQQPAFEQ